MEKGKGDELVAKCIFTAVICPILTPANQREQDLCFGWCGFAAEHFNQHQVEDNSLECHPAEGHQEEVVHSHGDHLTDDLK